MTKLGKNHAQNRSRLLRVRAAICALKQRPCEDCDIQYLHPAMEFDHVNGSKRFKLSRAAYSSMGAAMAEASKCEVVCANCRRIREYRRRPINER